MSASKSKVLYETLGIDVTATETDVSRSYRRLALQYHPDRNPDGAEVFKTISNAYAVLSDPEKRALYDATGIVSDGSGGASDEGVSTAERSAEMEAQVKSFFKTYAGSAEEREDAVKGYQKCDGNFRKMVREYLLFDNGVDGEVVRLLKLVKSLIASGRLESSTQFEQTTTPDQIRKVERFMAKERREAEAALKEMGLDGASRGGDGDLGALQALIQQRQRQTHDTLLHDMEQRYCTSKKPREAAARKRSRSPDYRQDGEKRKKNARH